MDTTRHMVDTSCRHCGGYHDGMCPRVRAVEYHRDGTVKRVEYHDPFSYDQPTITVTPFYPPNTTPTEPQNT